MARFEEDVRILLTNFETPSGPTRSPAILKARRQLRVRLAYDWVTAPIDAAETGAASSLVRCVPERR
jgi:hypothetical protein